jgi:hypothetical protein
VTRAAGAATAAGGYGGRWCVGVRGRVRASCHVRAVRPKSGSRRVRPPASATPGECDPRRVQRGRTPSDQDRPWLHGALSTSRSRVQSYEPRPETVKACGFSGLRAGFVLRDESSRPQRSRASHGSGRATREHDQGSPALGTRPPPLAILRSTNRARVSEEPAAKTARYAWHRRTLPTQGAGRPGGSLSPELSPPRLVCERGSPFARAAPAPRAALSTSRSRVQSCEPRPGRRSARMGVPAHIPEEARVRRKPGSGGSPGAAGNVATSAPRNRPAPTPRPRRSAAAAANSARRLDAARRYASPPARRVAANPAPPRRRLGTPPRRHHAASTPPRRRPAAANPARRYNPGRCRTPSSS